MTFSLTPPPLPVGWCRPAHASAPGVARSRPASAATGCLVKGEVVEQLLNFRGVGACEIHMSRFRSSKTHKPFLCLFLLLSPSRPPFLPPPSFLSLFSLPPSLPPSLPLSLALFLSLARPHSLSRSPSLSLSLSLCVSLSLSLSRARALSLSLSLFLSLSLCLCLSVCLSRKQTFDWLHLLSFH
jgi:hypothetical protein